MKKIILFVIAICLFVGLAISVSAEGTCGGHVSCECGDQLNESRTMDGTDNLTNCTGSVALYIVEDDITLDCDGYTISGDGNDAGIGVDIDGEAGVTIENCLIMYFYDGVNIDDGGNNNLLRSNTIINNSGHAVTISESADNNTIRGGEIGDNSDTSTDGGVRISGSAGTTVRGVYMHNNKYAAVYLTGSSDHTTIIGNNIDSNCGGQAGISASNSDSLVVKDNRVTNGTGYGIELYNMGGILIENNVIAENSNDGIYMYDCEDSLIVGNDIFDNPGQGIYIRAATGTNHTILNNDIINNSERGIYVRDETQVNIIDNVIQCIRIGDDSGIQISGSDDFLLDNNVISKCYAGVYVSDSQNISINEEIYDCVYGVYTTNGAGSEDPIIISNSEIHDNCLGLSARDGSYVIVENTDFDDNGNVTSGLFVKGGMPTCLSVTEITGGIYSHSADVDILNGNYINNGQPESHYEGPYNVHFAVYDEVDETINMNVTEAIECTDNAIAIYGELEGIELITRTDCPIFLMDDEVCGGDDLDCICGDTVTGDITFGYDLDCNGEGLVVGEDNITIDCNGYSIFGNWGEVGIDINDHTGVTIQNCNINSYSIGILVNNSENVSLLDNSIDNTVTAVRVNDSTGLLIDGNNITDFGEVTGVHFENVNDSDILNNFFEGGDFGVILEYCNGITVDNNGIYDVYDGGIGVFGSSDCEVTNNEIYARVMGVDSVSEASVQQFGPNVGIDLEGSHGLTVNGNHIEDMFEGIFMGGVNGSTVNNNVIKYDGEMIRLPSIEDTRVSDLHVQQMELPLGIIAIETWDVEINGNSISDMPYGVVLELVEYIEVNNNIINLSEWFFFPFSAEASVDQLGESTIGIFVYWGSDVEIDGNSITGLLGGVEVIGSEWINITNNIIDSGFLFMMGEDSSVSQIGCIPFFGIIVNDTYFTRVQHNQLSNNFLGIFFNNSYFYDIYDNLIFGVNLLGVTIITGMEGPRPGSVDEAQVSEGWEIGADNRIAENRIYEAMLGLVMTDSSMMMVGEDEPKPDMSVAAPMWDHYIDSNIIEDTCVGMYFYSGYGNLQYNYISNNEISNNGKDDCEFGLSGMAFYNNRYTWLEGNIVNDNDEGVFIEESANFMIVENQMNDNDCYALNVKNSGDIDVYGNTMLRNFDDPDSCGSGGIPTSISSYLGISGEIGASDDDMIDVVDGVSTHKMAAMFFQEVNGSEVGGNTVSDNHKNGIMLFRSYNNMVYLNTAENNAMNGIVVKSNPLGSSENNSIFNNIVKNNVRAGIFEALWSNGDTNYIEYNDASNNGYAGIVSVNSASDIAYNIIDGNNPSGNLGGPSTAQDEFAAYMPGGLALMMSEAEVFGNIITNNKFHGIVNYDTETSPNIYNNTIEDNEMYGIRNLDADTDNLVTLYDNNTFSGNGDGAVSHEWTVAVYVSDECKNDVSHATIEVYDVNGTLLVDGFTDEGGMGYDPDNFNQNIEIQEYMYTNAGLKVNNSPHLFNVSKGLASATEQENITDWWGGQVEIMLLEAPIITLISPPESSTFEAGSIIWFDIMDDADGCGGSLDMWWSDDNWTSNSTVFLNGSYGVNTSDFLAGAATVSVIAEDEDGNSAEEAFDFTVTAGSPPVITMTNPEDGGTVSAGDDINFSIADANLDTVWWNNGTADILIVGLPFQINTGGWAEGSYDIEVHANDTTANEAVETFTVNVDDTAPNVTIDDITPGDYEDNYKGSYFVKGTEIEYTADDANTLTIDIELCETGGNCFFILEDGANTGSFTLDSSELKEIGSIWGDVYYEVRVTASDGVNDATDTEDMRVDKSAPTVESFTSSVETVCLHQTIDFELIGYDNLVATIGNLMPIKVSGPGDDFVWGDDVGSCTPYGGNLLCQWTSVNFDAEPEGTYTYRPYDFSGLTGTSLTFDVDHTCIYSDDTLGAPPGGNGVAESDDGNVSLNVTASDSGAMADLEIIQHDTNPGGSYFGVAGMNTFIQIETDDLMDEEFEYMILKVYYDPKDIPAGVAESELRIYYYNEDTGVWKPEPLEGGKFGVDYGVNTAENYIWAKITHLSIFGVFGVPTTTTTPTVGRSSAGGCVKWDCDWQCKGEAAEWVCEENVGCTGSQSEPSEDDDTMPDCSTADSTGGEDTTGEGAESGAGESGEDDLSGAAKQDLTDDKEAKDKEGAGAVISALGGSSGVLMIVALLVIVGIGIGVYLYKKK